MELHEKLEILTAAAKYDVSCSSSGSNRGNEGGIGNASRGGICHSWTSDGRCLSLLKILLSNRCIYSCSYCINSADNEVPRTSFTPEEVANLTLNFYRRNYIEGLFLSSAVEKSPTYTMERLYRTARILREEEGFYGYIHLKAIPGADYAAIRKAGEYADRVSVNIELPSEKSLNKLAPGKNKEAILGPMKKIGNDISSNEKERKRSGRGKFVPAGQSTQMIVGASPEPDSHIMDLSESLYDNFNMKRVYYSAFVPVRENQNLPGIADPPLLREHRLYQADWLIRRYNFETAELFNGEEENLDYRLDPKAIWALNHPEFFPVEVNAATYDELIRVPGLGSKSASRILKAGRHGSVDYDFLKEIGVVLKRGKFFLTCKGEYRGGLEFRPEKVREKLLRASGKKLEEKQLPLFEPNQFSEKDEDAGTDPLLAAVSGSGTNL
ncbi:putative DNA modification/repair radical SAM protein [Candidatus Bipolaricaulota bacterium]|nr:putative DNA modification/repair radical SAM protein [Candidatus Bipolaricaulota bacterium]MBS3792728.1 putative DNA modification/repair radical SAM protein [Candidatus Bipolaricaulota bacterium]